MIETEFAGAETGFGIEGLLLSFPAAAMMRQLFSSALIPTVSKSTEGFSLSCTGAASESDKTLNFLEIAQSIASTTLLVVPDPLLESTLAIFRLQSLAIP